MQRSVVPWRERIPAAFPKLENEMEDLMERYFGNEEWGANRFSPSLNVTENDKRYEVTVELAGLKPEEVSVELNQGNLQIFGEKKEEREEKDETYHRIERRHGKFRRVVQLPGLADEANVEARFENGVLTVKVPKREDACPKKIPVKS